jgi:hypothetical protein
MWDIDMKYVSSNNGAPVGSKMFFYQLGLICKYNRLHARLLFEHETDMDPFGEAGSIRPGARTWSIVTPLE